MKKIAVCVTTFEHPDTIYDVLSKSVDDYYRAGIDIYYYDSSNDDSTEKIITSFIEQGYENLYYVKVECGFDDKIDLIYLGYGLKREYDYIWPTKDRSFCPYSTLVKVLQATEEEHDLIMLAVISGNEHGERVYTDPKEFYGDWGWLATSLDVLIYKFSFILGEYRTENYDKSLRNYLENWRVFVFCFDRLAELENGQIKVLMGNDVAIYNSRYSNSMWEKSVFLVWKEYWLQANDDLPQCYHEHKAKVIKRVTSLPWILGGVERLTDLHKAGLLVPEKLEEIEKDWERVSDISIEKLRRIAWGVYDYYHDVEAIGQTNNDIINTMIELHGMIAERRINIKDIPIDDILECVRSTFYSKYPANCKFAGIFEGSVQDIGTSMRNIDDDPEAICRLLQILINLLLLMSY